MPPSPRGPVEIGMKAPMLGNAEEIDQRSGLILNTFCSVELFVLQYTLYLEI